MTRALPSALALALNRIKMALNRIKPCVNRIDFAIWLNRIRVRAKTILHYQIPYRLTAPIWFIRFMRFKGIRIIGSVSRWPGHRPVA
jgi:hypothetical protein